MEATDVMQQMFQEARARNLWFYCAYQGLWFAPAELEAARAVGRFEWGPENWELREPHEHLQELEARVKSAELAAANLRKRITDNWQF